jgi:hypothetical protein
VKATVPVNKFPDFVAAMVTKLKRLFPVMGRRRIAAFLARAGLHIAPSTVRRMLSRAPATETPAPVAPANNPDEPLSSAKPRTAIANYPNHVWGIDTTAVPTSTGFSASRSPLESRGQSSRLPLAIVDGPAPPPSASVWPSGSRRPTPLARRLDELFRQHWMAPPSASMSWMHTATPPGPTAPKESMAPAIAAVPDGVVAVPIGSVNDP